MTSIRRKIKSYPLSVGNVVCVGNLHSGGSGKTPTVVTLANALSEFFSVVIVSRGYGGNLEGRVVEVFKDSEASLVGDEALMVKNQTNLPVFCGVDRNAAIAEVRKHYQDAVVLLDDGFQRLSTGRAINLVCISAEKDPLDAHCLPHGEMRESLSALGYADAVVLTGYSFQYETQWRDVLGALSPEIPIFKLVPTRWELVGGSGPIETDKLLLGFCGIANPEAFEKVLAGRGGQLIGAYPDHHTYKKSDIDDIVTRRIASDAAFLVTTDKDWYKVRSEFGMRGEEVFSLRSTFEFAEDFPGYIKTRLLGDV